MKAIDRTVDFVTNDADDFYKMIEQIEINAFGVVPKEQSNIHKVMMAYKEVHENPKYKKMFTYGYGPECYNDRILNSSKKYVLFVTDPSKEISVFSEESFYKYPILDDESKDPEMGRLRDLIMYEIKGSVVKQKLGFLAGKERSKIELEIAYNDELERDYVVFKVHENKTDEFGEPLRVKQYINAYANTNRMFTVHIHGITDKIKLKAGGSFWRFAKKETLYEKVNLPEGRIYVMTHYFSNKGKEYEDISYYDTYFQFEVKDGELVYDENSKRKGFYDLGGMKTSNSIPTLSHPACFSESINLFHRKQAIKINSLTNKLELWGISHCTARTIVDDIRHRSMYKNGVMTADLAKSKISNVRKQGQPQGNTFNHNLKNKIRVFILPAHRDAEDEIINDGIQDFDWDHPELYEQSFGDVFNKENQSDFSIQDRKEIIQRFDLTLAAASEPTFSKGYVPLFDEDIQMARFGEAHTIYKGVGMVKVPVGLMGQEQAMPYEIIHYQDKNAKKLEMEASEKKGAVRLKTEYASDVIPIHDTSLEKELSPGVIMSRSKEYLVSDMKNHGRMNKEGLNVVAAYITSEKIMHTGIDMTKMSFDEWMNMTPEEIVDYNRLFNGADCPILADGDLFSNLKIEAARTLKVISSKNGYSLEFKDLLRYLDEKREGKHYEGFNTKEYLKDKKRSFIIGYYQPCPECNKHMHPAKLIETQTTVEYKMEKNGLITEDTKFFKCSHCHEELEAYPKAEKLQKHYSDNILVNDYDNEPSELDQDMSLKLYCKVISNYAGSRTTRSGLKGLTVMQGRDFIGSVSGEVHNLQTGETEYVTDLPVDILVYPGANKMKNKVLDANNEKLYSSNAIALGKIRFSNAMFGTDICPNDMIENHSKYGHLSPDLEFPDLNKKLENFQRMTLTRDVYDSKTKSIVTKQYEVHVTVQRICATEVFEENSKQRNEEEGMKLSAYNRFIYCQSNLAQLNELLSKYSRKTLLDKESFGNIQEYLRIFFDNVQDLTEEQVVLPKHFHTADEDNTIRIKEHMTVEEWEFLKTTNTFMKELFAKDGKFKNGSYMRLYSHDGDKFICNHIRFPSQSMVNDNVTVLADGKNVQLSKVIIALLSFRIQAVQFQFESLQIPKDSLITYTSPLLDDITIDNTIMAPCLRRKYDKDGNILPFKDRLLNPKYIDMYKEKIASLFFGKQGKIAKALAYNFEGLSGKVIGSGFVPSGCVCVDNNTWIKEFKKYIRENHPEDDLDHGGKYFDENGKLRKKYWKVKLFHIYHRDPVLLPLQAENVVRLICFQQLDHIAPLYKNGKKVKYSYMFKGFKGYLRNAFDMVAFFQEDTDGDTFRSYTSYKAEFQKELEKIHKESEYYSRIKNLAKQKAHVMKALKWTYNYAKGEFADSCMKYIKKSLLNLKIGRLNTEHMNMAYMNGADSKDKVGPLTSTCWSLSHLVEFHAHLTNKYGSNNGRSVNMTFDKAYSIATYFQNHIAQDCGTRGIKSFAGLADAMLSNMIKGSEIPFKQDIQDANGDWDLKIEDRPIRDSIREDMTDKGFRWDGTWSYQIEESQYSEMREHSVDLTEQEKLDFFKYSDESDFRKISEDTVILRRGVDCFLRTNRPFVYDSETNEYQWTEDYIAAMDHWDDNGSYDKLIEVLDWCIDNFGYYRKAMPTGGEIIVSSGTKTQEGWSYDGLAIKSLLTLQYAINRDWAVPFGQNALFTAIVHEDIKDLPSVKDSLGLLYDSVHTK